MQARWGLPLVQSQEHLKVNILNSVTIEVALIDKVMNQNSETMTSSTALGTGLG